MADARLKQLEERLKEINCNFRFWARPELKELSRVLLPGEILQHCVIGSYEGGFALLAATDQRVLLVDKKPMYLTLEDVRYDMIVEVDYNHRLLNSNVFICTPNKSLRFVAYNQARLRELFHFIQTRVAEIRQHYTMLQQGQTQPEVFSQPMLAEQFQIGASASVPQVPQVTTTIENKNTVLPLEIQSTPQSRLHVPKISYAQAYRHAVPAISAYTRLPLMSRQRRFLGSRAMNSPQPSIYR
jgi:hypothetical protein